jgi:hypothetical protein
MYALLFWYMYLVIFVSIVKPICLCLLEGEFSISQMTSAQTLCRQGV